jgi:hypothetical protein
VEVTAADKIASGGGLVEENEDILTVSHSPEELAQAVVMGQIQDAKNTNWDSLVSGQNGQSRALSAQNLDPSNCL